MNFPLTRRAQYLGFLAVLSFGCSVDSAGDDAAAGGSSGGTTTGVAGGGTTTTTPMAGASGSAVTNGGGGGAGGMGGMSSGGTSAGTAGSGGTASGGASAAMPSAGCTMPAGQALGSWVEQPKLNVKGTDRQWWVWLPAGYDPTHAYPVVFTFHGCGSPDNYVPIQKAAGNDAIIVRGTGITGGCWTYGATGDDVYFFDAMLADVEATRCADSSRVFTSGYSSGSWLVNTLNCERGDKLRASASVSGGVAVNTSMCPGSATPDTPPKPKEFGRFFTHDQEDPTNDFVKNGNKAELARIVAANHCNATATPVPEDPSPCARYQGCDAGFPVVMCPSMNKGHDRRDDIAPTAFWNFFKSF